MYIYTRVTITLYVNICFCVYFFLNGTFPLV